MLIYRSNSRYKRKSVKDLYEMLHNCNEQLEQFSHVNKKALNQYANFAEQREEFQKRKEELIAGDEVLFFSRISSFQLLKVYNSIRVAVRKKNK